MICKYLKTIVPIFAFSIVLGVSNTQAQTVLEIIKENPQTSDFARAIEQTGLESRLSNDGPYTVFAPSNKAFSKLSKNERSNTELLLNHVITGTATKRSLRYMKSITSLSGLTIEVAQMDGNSLSIQNYPLIASNIRADNGVLHIIGGVIR